MEAFNEEAVRIKQAENQIKSLNSLEANLDTILQEEKDNIFESELKLTNNVSG